jgi:hypothetical protein
MCNGNCDQGRRCDCVTYVFDGPSFLALLLAGQAIGIVVGFLVGFWMG